MLLAQHQPIELGQRRGNARGQLDRLLRGLHAVAFADEQRVLQHDAQAGQRVGQGRLGHAQALGGAGDVALVHQGEKHRQQVQVVAHPVILASLYLKFNK